VTAYATVNNQQIVSADLMIPYYGIWTADVVLAATSTIPSTQGGCMLTIGNLTLLGSAFRMASFAGSRSIRLVGGYGGWRTPILPKAYANSAGVSLRMVLSDVASEVGEQLNLAQDDQIGPFYIREGTVNDGELVPAERVLRQLAGPLWWVDTTGVTQVNTTRPSTQITTPFQVIEWSGAKGHFTVATEDNMSWLPGNTFSTTTVTTTQTISMTSLKVTGDGKLRMSILSTGEADLP
jgi:hypothetical protein